jgi:hypothetical protein
VLFSDVSEVFTAFRIRVIMVQIMEPKGTSETSIKLHGVTTQKTAIFILAPGEKLHE